MDVNGLITTIGISDRYYNKVIEDEIATDGDDDDYIQFGGTMYESSSKDAAIASADFLGATSLINCDQHFALDNIENQNTFKEIQILDSQSSSKEIISYQRFGKIDKKVFTNLNFKCHLCGFSCAIRETLLKHFDEDHPI